MESPQLVQSPVLRVVISVVVFIGAVALYTYLIMIIWNKVIITKFPESNIQQLDFWDALSLSIFVSLISGFSQMVFRK